MVMFSLKKKIKIIMWMIKKMMAASHDDSKMINIMSRLDNCSTSDNHHIDNSCVMKTKIAVSILIMVTQIQHVETLI